MRAASDAAMPDRLGAMSETTTSTAPAAERASSAARTVGLAEVALR